MAGCTNPTGVAPALKRAALTRDIIAAITGADAEVPDTGRSSPPFTMLKLLAAADISGYPLPPTAYPGIGAEDFPFTYAK